MVKKVEEPKSFDWKSLYLYAVSLITLLICLFAVISMIRSGVDVAFPDYGYIDPYAQTNGVKVDQELIKQAKAIQAQEVLSIQLFKEEDYTLTRRYG